MMEACHRQSASAIIVEIQQPYLHFEVLKENRVAVRTLAISGVPGRSMLGSAIGQSFDIARIDAFERLARCELGEPHLANRPTQQEESTRKICGDFTWFVSGELCGLASSL
jgi:hypothetical protein